MSKIAWGIAGVSSLFALAVGSTLVNIPHHMNATLLDFNAQAEMPLGTTVMTTNITVQHGNIIKTMGAYGVVTAPNPVSAKCYGGINMSDIPLDQGKIYAIDSSEPASNFLIRALPRTISRALGLKERVEEVKDIRLLAPRHG